MADKISINGVIDRFEGEYAVVLDREGGSLLDIPRKVLPEGAEEGSFVEIRIKVRKNKTREAMQKVEKMIKKLKVKS